MCGRLGLDVLAAPVCCSITERKRQRNRRRGARKFQRWPRTPRWVGLLRCRPCGCAPPCWYQPSWRRAAGGGGEEQLGRRCWLTSRTDGRFSCDRNQPGCLKSDASCSAAPMHAQIYIADASAAGRRLAGLFASSGCGSYRSEAATSRARSFARACDFKPRVARGAEHAAVKLKAAPRARRRAAMMHR